MSHDVFISYSHKDKNISNVSIDENVKPAFDLLGAPPEHKQLILYETDHIPPRAEFIREILAWMETYLGPVR